MDAPNRNDRARVLAIAAACLALAALALFIPSPLQGRMASASGDLVHAPLFGVLTFGALWLVQYFRPLPLLRPTFIMRSALVVALVFAVGVGSELAQTYFHRSRSVHDAIANGLGITAAWLCYLAWQHKQTWPARRPVRILLVAAAGLLIGVASWGPLKMLRDILAVRQQFPLIASFEAETALLRWYFRKCEGQFTDQDVTDGLRAMEVTVKPTSNPGPTLCELYPDWSEMASLEMDVTLDTSFPRESVELLIMIFDQYHREDGTDAPRFAYTLQPGVPRHIEISRNEILAKAGLRLIDLSRIRFLSLMILEPGTTTSFRVDAIKLRLRH